MKRLVSAGYVVVAQSISAFFITALTTAYSFDNVADRLPEVGTDSHHGDWPFSIPVKPALPDTADGEWSKNPIDRFVWARLQSVGLKPSPYADKVSLLRRVTYDLTGLPPKPYEVAAFLSDDSPDAYARVVDRLLASPRFGERWAQHWLDLVRYAETEGFKADNLREHAFRYRDYVIDSFNADRPFDEFIRQQLAGDELEPDNPTALIATGFLRLYPDEDNAANLFQRRQEILDDVTDTTSLVFLGITMGCAQCHDHKFDDIPQTDYYRLQAFFVSMAPRDDQYVATSSDAAQHAAERTRWEQATADVRREIANLFEPLRDKMVEFNLEKYEPAIVACYRKPSAERTPFEEQIARMVEWRMERQLEEDTAAMKLSKNDQQKYQALKKQLAKHDSLKPAPLPMAMSVCDVGRDAPPTHLLDGGNWKRPLQLLEPGFPAILVARTHQEPAATVSRRESTTGRRSQLAQWLTSRDHPLTARVIVNRLWQHHFGRGIVATPNDFGIQGERPTHPDLLDWLAVELMDNGWSLKHVHRLMVTSATYRMTSTIDLADPNTRRAVEADHDNKLLWRANRRRLEGEAIRDAMLQVSGELNLKMHGPSARPKLPAEVSKRYAWEPDEDPDAWNRRSVYILAKRNMRFPLFEAFDQPDLHQSCARRAVTVTAPQSLAMLNSELTLDLARRWAERLLAKHADSPRELIQSAFQSAFSREPTEQEVDAANLFLQEQSQLISNETDGDTSQIEESPGNAFTSHLTPEPVADFCHGLFNSNEFITVD
jgi:hypothetical protein